MESKMMKLAEFAEFCGTTRDTLLWYDKMGILKPAAVGENGYRYYFSRQFFDFDLISTLKQTGSSIREIAAYKKNQDHRALHGTLSEKSRELTEQMQQLRQMKSLIDAISRCIELTDSARLNEPELIHMDAEYLVSTQAPKGCGWFQKNEEKYVYSHIKSYAQLAGVERYPMGVVMDRSALNGSTPTNLRYFYRADERTDAPLEERPAGEYVRMFHGGSYDGIRESVRLMAEFIAANGCTVCGDIYEYDIMAYPIMESDRDFVCMLLIPVYTC